MPDLSIHTQTAALEAFHDGYKTRLRIGTPQQPGKTPHWDAGISLSSTEMATLTEHLLDLATALNIPIHLGQRGAPINK